MGVASVTDSWATWVRVNRLHKAYCIQRVGVGSHLSPPLSEVKTTSVFSETKFINMHRTLHLRSQSLPQAPGCLHQHRVYAHTVTTSGFAASSVHSIVREVEKKGVPVSFDKVNASLLSRSVRYYSPAHAQAFPA